MSAGAATSAAALQARTEQGTPQALRSLLESAQAAMRTGQWQVARQGFERALPQAPRSAQLHHNLALCHWALGQAQQALQSSRQALALAPLWQTHLIEGNALAALKQHEAADDAFVQALRLQPGNAQAVLARADLAMNIFGMPRQAIEWVQPLLADPGHGTDAMLTTLMANVYDREVSAQALSQAVIAFSKRHLRLPPGSLAPLPPRGPRRAGPAGLRPRVALISPLFCASPVYFLTIAGWRHVARGSDIVVFNRGHKSDWATEELKALAHEWHEVQPLTAQALAQQIHASDIDVLYDLGGWMDAAALQALSAKPAREMFKWVGGQSLTTGLESFDGWIGDDWQSPHRLQHLYTEPLVNIAGGYATYTPPPYLPSAPVHKLASPVIFSNPAKLSRRFLAWLATVPGPKVFVHKQFRYERTRETVLRALAGHAVEFICPTSHREALQVLGRHEWMLDTFPYSSGLTAREALAMGVKVRGFEGGELFCERHSLGLMARPEAASMQQLGRR